MTIHYTIKSVDASCTNIMFKGPSNAEYNVIEDFTLQGSLTNTAVS